MRLSMFFPPLVLALLLLAVVAQPAAAAGSDGFCVLRGTTLETALLTLAEVDSLSDLRQAAPPDDASCVERLTQPYVFPASFPRAQLEAELEDWQRLLDGLGIALPTLLTTSFDRHRGSGLSDGELVVGVRMCRLVIQPVMDRILEVDAEPLGADDEGKRGPAPIQKPPGSR